MRRRGPFYSTFPNRTLCDVLSDMRKCVETLHFGPLPSLIEEAQIMGNRMEAGLYDKGDLEEMHKHKKELKKEIKELEETLNASKERESKGT